MVMIGGILVCASIIFTASFLNTLTIFEERGSESASMIFSMSICIPSLEVAISPGHA
jgi:hypothetical protein